MNNSEDMTIGEIGRTLRRLEDSQSLQMTKLDEIKEQTTKTNGTVIRHEERLNSHDREIRDLKRSTPHPADSRQHTMRRAADQPGAMTLTVPKNTLIAIGVVLGTAIATAIAALLGVKLPL